MANKSVFASIKGRLLPKATAINAHAAPAYAYSDAHALAQVAVTGTFGGMFYQSPQEELEYVRSAGCHLVQGYYFSTPLTAEKMQPYLEGELTFEGIGSALPLQARDVA